MRYIKTPETVNLDNVRLKIYEEFSPEIIAEDFEVVNNIDEYRNLIDDITENVNKLFENYLKNYPDYVKEAFNKWRINQFEWNEQEKEELVKLIYEKNRVFYDIFLAYVEKWWLDNLLTSQDVSDLLSLLKIWVTNFYDKIFVNWYLDWNKYVEKIPGWLWYAWINQNGLVSYFDLAWLDNTSDFWGMFNENLKKYLKNIFDYSKSIYNQEKWDEIQMDEVSIWKDTNSKLGFVWPQEAYMLENEKWKLVEPHIALYIKESFEKERKEAEDLYEKYFWENYNVSQVNTYLVEPLLEAWSQWFRKIAGESVPNSETVANKTWRINLIIPSRWRKRILDAKDTFSKLVWKQVDSDYFEKIVKVSDKFVKFHELWHSLFKWTKYDSNLEELKADLSYFLKIYDELKNWQKQDVDAFVGEFVIDVIRVFRNINVETKEPDKSMYRYIVSKAIELGKAFETGFLKIKSNKLVFNNEKFKDFVAGLKDVLFEIKEIYDTQNKDKENKLIEKYSFKNKENWEIVELVNL